jgi:predicted ABC-type ATPase
MPTCWIFTGSNGAGKTTFAMECLPKVESGTNFVNADLIAAGLGANYLLMTLCIIRKSLWL